MGRRAKKAPIQTKKKITLSKQFKCPFCANEDAVECKMDFRGGIGSLACRLCGASYQMPIHHLHEAVDVFSEWLDDCEAAAQGKTTGGDMPPPSAPQNSGGDGRGAPSSRYDDDDDIPQASGLSSKRGRDSEATASKPNKKKSAKPAKKYSALGLDDSDDSDDE